MTISHSAADGFLPVALNGRNAGLLPQRSCHPIVVDYKHQRIDGTERGARSWGMCRQFPAAYHAQGRSHVRPVGCGFPFVTRGLCDDLPVTGGGLGRPTFHHFDFRTQPTWQGIADVLPSHFLSLRHSVVAGIKPSRGVSADVPNHRGEFPKAEGERQDVLS